MPKARWIMQNKISTLDEFTVEDGILMKYSGDSNIVNVPDGVECIFDLAFFSKSHIKSLKLPDTLVEIGSRPLR